MYFRSLIFGAMAVLALQSAAGANNAKSTAKEYPIVQDRVTPGFFEGALLGNGGMGIVVTTRPDAILLHFGHNNVWDIRVTENHTDQFGTFEEIFAKADALPDTLPSIHHDKEFSDYLSMTADNYRSPYPRPFPCGSLLLGIDRREVELLGYNLDISDGTCRISLLKGDRPLTLTVTADMASDDAWIALTDSNGNPEPSCFERLRLIPDPSTPGDIPHYDIFAYGSHTLGFYQQLPAVTSESNPDRDKAFALQLWCSDKLTGGERTTISGHNEPLGELERYIEASTRPFLLRAHLDEGIATQVKADISVDNTPVPADYQKSLAASAEAWDSYWAASGINLADKELEKIWYRNMYFFNCAIKPGVTCPGIFANWSYGNIGTAWHGDYHLNYNTQQPFWLTFSSNHLDKNLVYADLVDHLMPVSTKWAREYYNMRGAFFPHSAYPVEMGTHPYPVPDWGWEVFETPWMVQGLWWHYLYSGDTVFLRDRAFTPMKAAVEFLVDYMSRPDAHGNRWDDNLYHIFPSVPPELYGLQPGFKFNHDTQIDLTLARHIFNAYLQSVDILHMKKEEKALVNDVNRLLTAMPGYPTAKSDKYGEILVSVPGEGDDIVYNVPANLAVVFPGNEYGLSSPDSIRSLVASTIRAHRNEGGNEIVFLNMQKARMGMLDLDRFKRQIAYATLPNATITDAVLETGGRYSDLSDYMYMAPMGIWFENFAIAAVINECLLQSYDNVIRLFPNWEMADNASFSTLRAQGAFLVSASTSHGEVDNVTITSERGNECRLYTPWPGKDVTVSSDGSVVKCTQKDGMIIFPTKPSTTYTITCK